MSYSQHSLLVLCYFQSSPTSFNRNLNLVCHPHSLSTLWHLKFKKVVTNERLYRIFKFGVLSKVHMNIEHSLTKTEQILCFFLTTILRYYATLFTMPRSQWVAQQKELNVTARKEYFTQLPKYFILYMQYVLRTSDAPVEHFLPMNNHVTMPVPIKINFSCQSHIFLLCRCHKQCYSITVNGHLLMNHTILRNELVKQGEPKRNYGYVLHSCLEFSIDIYIHKLPVREFAIDYFSCDNRVLIKG